MIMKYLYYSVFVFLISLGINASPDLKRINLIVSDLDQSLGIYRDVIGMEVFEIKNSEKGSYAYKVFNLPEDADMRYASLNIGSKTRGFSLTEVKNAELPSLDGIKMTTAVIQVKGLREIYDKIIDMNLYSTEIDEDTTPEGITFAEFSFTDYDGHLVVLYELK
jgi:catechol 2,3-dioxygenase-like lactoylglutathione lyase family enzyme